MTRFSHFSLLALLLLVIPVGLLGQGGEPARPHLSVEIAGNATGTQLYGVIPGRYQLDNAQDMMAIRSGLGLGLRLDYSWLRVRAGLQSPTRGAYDFTYEITGGVNTGTYQAVTSREEFHHLAFQAWRLPLSIGFGPDWKVAPYLDLGVFVDFQRQIEETTQGTYVETTYTLQHALGCGCSWWGVTSVSEGDLPTQVRTYDNAQDAGLFVNLGVKAQLFPRHLLFLEARYGSGRRTIGADQDPRQRFLALSFGYSFQFF